jgi:hypothetical protein
MSKVSMKLFTVAMSLTALCLLSLPAHAAKAVNVTAALAGNCSNCQTDISDVTGVYSSNPDGPYSLQSDGSSYASPEVESQILTNNSVYTLDTMNTLVNGLVGPGTRTVGLHFFSPVEGKVANDVLPACWGGNHDQDQAVNWSVFASNSVNFPLMAVGRQYPGFARMDFNVRNGVCDNQVYRFRLQWYNVCITRTGTSPNTWVITSDSCGAQINYGTASLIGQGGKNQTIGYGDWREPFQLTLTQ